MIIPDLQRYDYDPELPHPVLGPVWDQKYALDLPFWGALVQHSANGTTQPGF